MSTQPIQSFGGYATSQQSRRSHRSSDGVRTYVDSNGDTVQVADTDVFNGLRNAGGEAFVSDSENEYDTSSDSDDEAGYSSSPRSAGSYPGEKKVRIAHPVAAQIPPSAMKATREDKRAKKEKKEKRKKSRKEKYYGGDASAADLGGSPPTGGAHGHACCSCGHGGRH